MEPNFFFFISVFVTRFSTNVLKARHFGFTPHTKGGTLVLHLM